MPPRNARNTVPPSEEELALWKGKHEGARGVTRTLFEESARHRVRLHLRIEMFLAKLRRDKEWESACKLARETIRKLPPMEQKPRRAPSRAMRRRRAA